MNTTAGRVRMLARKLLVLTLAFAGAMAVGCSVAGEERRVPERFNQDGTPALHAVQDARLRILMNEMNALLFERTPTELELDQVRRQKATQIADVADAMSRAVDEIVQNLPQLSLTGEEESVFLVLAGRLRDQVTTLQAQARGNYVDSIPGTIEQMSATCDGCHQLFRDPVRRDTPPGAQQ